MREIKPDIFLVDGENKSLFPFCKCLYLRGRKMRVLIDAGMGDARMDACLEKGVDLLILSHCHLDHRYSIGRIGDIPVWCHETESFYLQDRERYLEGIGLTRSGIDPALLTKKIRFPKISIERTMKGNEELDLGGMTLRAIHTPGHTPGHMAFHIPEQDFLFSSDVALTAFGPFYGNDFADIEDFISSIRALKDVGASMIATSHSGPYIDRLPERFSQYKEIIYKRDHVILKALSEPQRLADLMGRNIFFPDYPNPREIMIWMEGITIEKHLERLLGMGRIRKEGEYHVKEKP